MTTLLEIEKAIEKLPPGDLHQLSDWLEDYKMTLAASDSMFAMLDEEDGGSDQLVESEACETSS
jgi:hypothetical protein